ncbi:MAG: YbaK/EbsC family protein [Actinomyces sp.]|nr:MAG: YbaK/EbsC family protein [Actinomyces sp.]
MSRRRPALERFADAAAALGVEVSAVRYPSGTRTAQDAAAAIGCDVAQIVKSLVFAATPVDGSALPADAATPAGVVLVLTSGAHRVDTDRVGRHLGVELSRADPETARAATGFAIGGTPPFGHPRPLPTVLDRALLDHEVVYAAAGTPDACFPIDPHRLLAVTGAEVLEVAAA